MIQTQSCFVFHLGFLVVSSNTQNPGEVLKAKHSKIKKIAQVAFVTQNDRTHQTRTLESRAFGYATEEDSYCSGGAGCHWKRFSPSFAVVLKQGGLCPPAEPGIVAQGCRQICFEIANKLTSAYRLYQLTSECTNNTVVSGKTEENTLKRKSEAGTFWKYQER